MNMSFFSNYLNAHQILLCDELSNMPDINFSFISLSCTDSYIGRATLDKKRPYVICAYEKDGHSKALHHAQQDDIVIFGELQGHEEYVRARAQSKRPFYRQAERLLKRGYWWRFFPLKACRTYERFSRYSAMEMYVLCSSAYTSYDLSLSHFPKELCLKWGYFPNLAKNDNETKKDWTHIKENIGHSNGRVLRIGSAQRLIPWKHVELQLECARRLKAQQTEFHLYIAGNGPELSALKQRSHDLDLDKRVSFVGNLSQEEMQRYLANLDLFLLTSDRNEGWGAVVNESMAAGCVPIVSSAVGSAPFLINPGCNGLIFSDGDVEDLTNKVEILAHNQLLICNLQQKAKSTLADSWNARIAACRLREHALALIAGKKPPLYSKGPMSPAIPLDDRAFARRIKGMSNGYV